ncbi:recombinase family protein [Streptomyces scopuliridis]|uniref:recombinase family protein n=1 Tax=Streptomyces scopuliridis TaxID=452529 RepID=UPI0036884444
MAVVAARLSLGRRVLRAVDYLRVSTEEQAKGYGIAYSGRKTGNYIGEKGWEHLGTFFDQGVSGALESHERPALRRLMEQARAVPRPFDIVVVPEGRVIGRTGRAFWKWVWELQEIGIFVAVVKRDYDNSTPEGESKMRKDADYAEDERNIIRERTQGGLQEKAEDGGYVGGKVPYGYRVVGRGRPRGSRLALDACDSPSCGTKHEACALRRGRALFVAVRDWGRAAVALNAEGFARRDGRPWDGRSLRQQVLSPIVLEARQVFRGSGGVRRGREGRPANGDPVVIPLPPVFTPTEIEELRAAGGYPVRRVRTGRVYSLSGRIVSPCGRRYVGGGRSRRGRAYRCQGRIKATVGASRCSCPCLPAGPIEEQTWRSVRMFLGDAGRLEVAAGNWVSEGPGEWCDHEERRAELDRQIAIQTQAVALALGVAAKQVAERGLYGAEAERAVERLVAPVQAELDALFASQSELAVRRTASDAAGEKAGLLVELAAMAHRTLGRLSPEGQKEFMALLDVKVTFVEPPRRRRSGQRCAVAAWFDVRQLPVPLLSDEGWAKIAPLIRHRPRGVSPRLVMTGILYKVRTGTPWDDLPAVFGRPSTLQTHSARWRASGFWERAIQAIAGAQSTRLPAPSGLNIRIECSIEPQKLLNNSPSADAGRTMLSGSSAFTFHTTLEP